jgi:GH25 family lysozyme M1 (1,4-beta-N-acetylmuramidase)
MSYTHGIDISKYQGEIGWEALGQSRYRIVVAKLSEGIGGSQLDYALDAGNKARARGMDFTVYHFVDKLLRNTAKAEAKNFARLFAGLRHLCTVAPVLDVEPKGTDQEWGAPKMSRAALVAWAREWARCVEVRPIIYTPAGRSYVPDLLSAFRASPRWLSTRPWRNKAEDVDRPPAEPDWSLAPEGADVWQYSSRCGGVPGIKGNCDRNLFRDVCALRNHWRDQA